MATCSLSLLDCVCKTDIFPSQKEKKFHNFEAFKTRVDGGVGSMAWAKILYMSESSQVCMLMRVFINGRKSRRMWPHFDVSISPFMFSLTQTGAIFSSFSWNLLCNFFYFFSFCFTNVAWLLSTRLTMKPAYRPNDTYFSYLSPSNSTERVFNN